MTPARLDLAGTGLAVSRLCLGGNRLGAQLDGQASFALLDAFVEHGGNFLDTAHVYADWLPDVERSCSEKTIGRWLRARPGLDMVVATKAGHPRLHAPTLRRLDRASLRQDVEESLAFLGLGRLDLVYLHRDDPDRPAAEILGTLEEMRAEGSIRAYGASNWSTARLEEAVGVARRHGWPGFAANQPEWSLASRNRGAAAGDLLVMDDDLFAFHRRTRLPAVPYSAQAKGYFDKALAGSLDEATGRLFDNAANRARAEALGDAARRHGATPTEVALHVLTRAPFPTIPVVGCRTREQVASSFRSLALHLSDAEIASLAGWPASLR